MFRIDDGHPRWFQDEDVSLSYHSGTQIHHAFDFFTTLAIPRARSRRHRDTITILRPIILVRAPCLRPAISSYIFYHISLDWTERTNRHETQNSLTSIPSDTITLRYGYSPSITFRSWNIFSLDWVRLPHTASPAKWHAFNQQMPRLRYRWEGLAETG